MSGTGSVAGSRHQPGSGLPAGLAAHPVGSTSRAPPSSTAAPAVPAADGVAGGVPVLAVGGLATVEVGSSRALPFGTANNDTRTNTAIGSTRRAAFAAGNGLGVQAFDMMIGPVLGEMAGSHLTVYWAGRYS